ncbi:MAG: Na+/H+ antiporter subunit D [Actinobacteria bacterium]|nr:Na+/H+ antiporter subunit D [Actinomycetota bacterium]
MIVPLTAAALTIGFGSHRVVQRVISLLALAGSSAFAVAMLVHVDREGPLVVQAGNWPTPIGVTLVADRTAALLVAMATLVLLVSLVYAIGFGGSEREQDAFHPLYLLLTGGLCLAFLTGDLFNLFVGFEIFLMASYVLITFDGTREQVRRGSSYIVLGIVTSTLFLFALGFVYASAGTVNMADLHDKFAGLPEGVRAGLGALLFLVFGMKAAVFPLFGWLPDSYPSASTPVAAVFSGLLTKVGLYALLRTQTLIVPPGDRQVALMLAIAALTMVVGVLGAVGRTDIRGLLAFHIVSQVGYAVFGIALFSVSGIAGALFFILHQMAVKTSLFQVAGVLERRTGSTSISALSGFVRSAPYVSALFFVSAFSLAGIPPLSGFIGKLALVEAGVEQGAWVVTGVSLVVGLLTLFSMAKIWTGAFWGDPAEGVAVAPIGEVRGYGVMVGALTVIVLMGVALGLAAGPMMGLCTRAAEDLLDPAGYVRLVLG